MKDTQSLIRIGLPVAFFGILSGLLFFQSSMKPTTATIITVNGPTVSVKQVPSPQNPLPSCTKNEDCPLPTSYCHDGQCTTLQNPSCVCSQPQVLSCNEESGRARHLFCPKGCFVSENEITCQ